MERIDTIAFERGEKDFIDGRMRTSCPYNGPCLRDEWFAGFDYAKKERENNPVGNVEGQPTYCGDEIIGSDGMVFIVAHYHAGDLDKCRWPVRRSHPRA